MIAKRCCFLWYILFQAVITVLVIYAVINIIGKLIVAVFSPEPYNNKDAFVVIKVKNQERNIEGVVRSVIWQNLKISKGGYIPNILIVDTGSEDNTKEISEKLCSQYSFIFYTSEEQFERMKNNF